MISDIYRAQADLLLQVLPQVAKEDFFALKGGAAINLFVRDMPRLSVDIDLSCQTFDDRATYDSVSARQGHYANIQFIIQKTTR
jgi:hypothetical protein